MSGILQTPPQASFGCGEIAFELCPARAQAPIPEAQHFHEWLLPDGSSWTHFYRQGDGYLLRFPGLGDFELSGDGRRAKSWPVHGVSAGSIEHLFLNQVVPLALSRAGHMVLHGSATVIDEACVAFLGASGQGKSTLAASFASNGYPFLTDDGLLLGEGADSYTVRPNHSSVRLWDDSVRALFSREPTKAPPVEYTPKMRLLADDVLAHCTQPKRLSTVYVLARGAGRGVQIEQLPPSAALLELLRNSFLLDVDEQSMLARHFDFLARMVSRPMFYRLSFERNFEMLGEVRAAVIEHVAGMPRHARAQTHCADNSCHEA